MTRCGERASSPPAERHLTRELRPGILENLVDEGLDPSFVQAMRAVVLTTEDGIVWSRAPAQQLPARGENVQLFDITRGGPGLVAVGWRREHPGRFDAEIDPVVWTSADGTTWNEAADAEGAFSSQEVSSSQA